MIVKPENAKPENAKPVSAKPRQRPADRAALEAGLSSLGLAPDAQAVDRLLAHVGLLRHWGRTYNLVAPGDLDHLVSRHVLDALSIHSHVPPGPLLDVGTGAGFPGLPLAILSPERPVVLIDSAGKKVRFLRHVIRTLDLDGVEAVHGRVESFSASEEFRTITTRAFSSLAAFAGAVRHLAGPAARLLAMKGKAPEPELAALPPWARVEAMDNIAVPGLAAERHLVTLALDRPPQG